MKRAERIVLLGIVVAVAIALRWGFVATAFVPNPLRADAGEYARYAHNLVAHGTYSLSTAEAPPPDSFRSPGYPLLLAACRAAAGEAHWLSLVIALQVVFGAATVLLTFLLASRLLPFAAAVGAAALVALSPHLVVSSAYVLTECFTTFVLTLALWLLAAAPERSAPRHALAALLLGFAVLCNEVLVFVPVVLALPLVRRSGWRVASVYVGIALLPMLAWGVRNQTQDLARRGSERVVASISHGSYPGMVYDDPRHFGFPYRDDPEQPAFGSSWHDLRRVLVPRVEAEPLRYLSWYALQKPVWLWSWNLVQGNGVLVYDVSNNPYDRQAVVAASGWCMRQLHLPLMLLGALAAVWAARNRRGGAGFLAQALGLVAVFGTLAYLPVIPDPRYLQPFRPAIFVLAAVAAHRCVLWAVARRPVAAPVSSPV
ncbi:MAG: glycosyltransferase family 39 protein [Planctomycetes bacterium]|nr:glycosyltransferase family 39 protein [Planctomycetota bacterium]MCB9889879.1 glycosyltransferase family 39 protein [Planctomycetota bacterium]